MNRDALDFPANDMTPMQCLELQAQRSPRVREGMRMLLASHNPHDAHRMDVRYTGRVTAAERRSE
jgi:hypothetical protein